MLTDRYGLLVSTTSSTARDAYGEGCKAKLTMYPGAIEAFDRAVAADPGFTLAHATKAHALFERGDAAAARASMAAANSLIDVVVMHVSEDHVGHGIAVDADERQRFGRAAQMPPSPRRHDFSGKPGVDDESATATQTK